MSNNSGASRVAIPNTVRKTIQNIKEITGNHSDEDIYAMLKECSMDPNETTQRLLHLDTFHVVKRKCDKRKENVNSRLPEESRRKAGVAGYQGRGTRSGRGSSFSPYMCHGTGGGWSAAFQMENGVEDSRGKIFKPSPQPVSVGADARMMPPMAKSTSVTVNGSVKVPDSNCSGVQGDQLSAVPKHDTDAGATKSRTSLPLPKVDVEHAPSSLDPVLLPSHDSRLPTAVGAIKREVGSQRTTAERIASIPAERGVSIDEFTNQIEVNQLGSQGVDELESEMSSSMIEGAIGHMNMVQQKTMREFLGIEENHCSENSQLSACPVHDPAAGVSSSQQVVGLSRAIGPTEDFGQNQMSIELSDTTIEAGLIPGEGSSHPVVPNVSGVEEATLKLEKLKFSDGQHVSIPNHIQVADSVKSILSFGSLDVGFGAGINYLNNSESKKSSNNAAYSVDDEAATEPSSCHQDTPSTAEEGNYLDNSQTASCIQKEVSPLKGNISSDAPLKDEQLKDEKLPAVGPLYPVVQTNPSYSFAFMPPMVGSRFVQLEQLDAQARLSNPMSGNSVAMPITAPMPPVTQTVAGQSSIPVPPVPLPLLRQPYSPNYFSYSHYFNPFFVPPTLHQFFGHSGLPPQMQTGNVFLPPPGAAAGMKISPAPYKQGTNAGTLAHVGMLSGYGVYGSSQVGYSPSAAVTSGNPNTPEDLVQSALKESNIYPGQQSEGSAVWISAAGRESSNLPINSIFNLPPPAQHVTIAPHCGHGPFTAVYHPLQTIPAPATGHPLLQQSQSMPGSLESAGPPLSNG